MSKLLCCSSGRIPGASIVAMLVICPIGFAVAETATVGVQVTFVDSAAISDPSALRAASLPGQSPTGGESVTISTEEPMPGSPDVAEDDPQTSASLTITATPGRVMTIYVDSAVPATSYSLTDFRCRYNSATEVPCDGAGLTETAAASATLRVGATLQAGEPVGGTADGSFEVTVAYQ